MSVEWAFPRPASAGDYAFLDAQTGMTLRDYFAARALCGWYSGMGGLPHEDYLPEYAAHFYKMADAMMKEREK
jgi:hypothetical protein